ncbi:MAG: hypothetical protein ACRC2T_05250 [Thermoguttaceae bacterium]
MAGNVGDFLRKSLHFRRNWTSFTKLPLILIITGVLVIPGVLVYPGTLFAQSFTHVKDDTPLFRKQEISDLAKFFGKTSTFFSKENSFGSAEKVSFLQLEAQSAAYRGKIVEISGRLLKCEIIPVPHEFVQEIGRAEMFELWLRVSDQPTKPLSVILLKNPEESGATNAAEQLGLQIGQNVTVKGLFFKRRVFTTGSELLSTPTIIGEIADSKAENAANRTKTNAGNVKKQTEQIEPVTVGFLAEMLGVSESEWNEFEKVEQPLEIPQKDILPILSRLDKRIVQSILRDLHNPDFELENEESKETKSIIITEKEAVLKKFWQIPVSQENSKAYGFSDYYICQAEISKNRPKIADSANSDSADFKKLETVFCISAHVPAAFTVKGAQEQRIGFTGVALKTSPIRIYVAPRIEWFPDTLLGKHGFDAGSLDAVPVLPLSELAKKQKNGEKIDLTPLRFTEKDQQPFYQMLSAATKIPKEIVNEKVESELKKSGSDQFDVIDLFNRPEKFRDPENENLARIAGNARRIDKILVEDEEVKQQFGIDHYYQVTLFTDDSQSNPLVFCIRDIPSGLPCGSEVGFNIPISLTGFFYKTWAFRKMGENTSVTEPGEETSEKSSGTWQFAPLLIGAKVDWFTIPSDPHENTPSAKLPLYTSAVTFLALVFIWIIIRRRYRRNKPITFEIDKN